MKKKPVVCVIDDDPRVRLGWKQSLGQDALLKAYSTCEEFVAESQDSEDLLSSLACMIIGRYFANGQQDIVTSHLPAEFRSASQGPIFLNWQGYITKDELNNSFDGKLFHRYGVKWQTLRLRIQKFEKCQRLTRKPSAAEQGFLFPKVRTERPQVSSRPERCSQLLRSMATKASGQHKQRIEFYAEHDQTSGIALLEAIYNRLVTDKNTPSSCPSRYINSSPVIAKRMLHDALYC